MTGYWSDGYDISLLFGQRDIDIYIDTNNVVPEELTVFDFCPMCGRNLKAIGKEKNE
jgi:hypothetical protein